MEFRPRNYVYAYWSFGKSFDPVFGRKLRDSSSRRLAYNVRMVAQREGRSHWIWVSFLLIPKTKRFDYLSTNEKPNKIKQFFAAKQNNYLITQNYLFFLYRIPDDIYAAPLKVEQAECINEGWAEKSPDSLSYTKSIIMLNGGIGLYDKDTNKLLSWVLTNENLAPG